MLTLLYNLMLIFGLVAVIMCSVILVENIKERGSIVGSIFMVLLILWGLLVVWEGFYKQLVEVLGDVDKVEVVVDASGKPLVVEDSIPVFYY